MSEYSRYSTPKKFYDTGFRVGHFMHQNDLSCISITTLEALISATINAVATKLHHRMQQAEIAATTTARAAVAKQQQQQEK